MDLGKNGRFYSSGPDILDDMRQSAVDTNPGFYVPTLYAGLRQEKQDQVYRRLSTLKTGRLLWADVHLHILAWIR